MRYLLIGDIHLSDKPPSACTETYLDDLLAILEHTVSLEDSLNSDSGGIDAVVWSGDIFHYKQPNRNSHSLVQRALDIVHAYKNLYIVPGNHDMQSDRYDSLFETQPLGVLLKAGAKLLNGWADPPGPDAPGAQALYGVPWLPHWTQEALEASFRSWHTATPEKRAQALVVAHAPLFPPSLEPPWEYYPTGDSRHEIYPPNSGISDTRISWSEIQGSGSTFYGHVHDRHGVYTVPNSVGSVTFCNHGAITRGSLHESELQRAVTVTTWSPDEGFTEVAVPHRPSSEVFRLAEKREADDTALSLDTFLSSVGSATLEITSIESVLAYIRSLDLSPEIAKLAEDLLSQAGK